MDSVSTLEGGPAVLAGLPVFTALITLARSGAFPQKRVFPPCSPRGNTYAGVHSFSLRCPHQERPSQGGGADDRAPNRGRNPAAIVRAPLDPQRSGKWRGRWPLPSMQRDQGLRGESGV